MAGAAAGVKAGEAYAELTLQDRMSKKLDAAKAKFLAFSKRMAVAGAAATGVAGATLTALAGPLRTFLDMGGTLQDASDRTGVSAETLSALGYAADQVGVSLDSLQAGLKGMAKLTYGAKTGTKAAAETLDKLGISAAAFLAASPTQRLGMIADGLNRIEDPGLRAALAMRALGRGGVDLLPMLMQGSDGIARFVADAQRLGVVLSSQDVAAADELGDSIAGLTAQGKALAFQVGAALAGPLTTVVGLLRSASTVAIEFATNNRQLVVWIAAGAVALGVLGAALLATSAGAAAVAMVLGGVSSAIMALPAIISGVAAAFAFLVSPAGLIIMAVLAIGAAITAGVGTWLVYSESGRSALAWLTEGLGAILDVAKRTFGGITDAIVAGDWGLALQIALAGMRVYWEQFKAGLSAGWQAFVGFFSDSWIKMKAGAALAWASLPSMLMGVLNSLQQMVVGWANKVAEALGFEVRFDGIDAIRDMAARADKQAAQRRAQIIADASRDLGANQATRDKAAYDAAMRVDGAQIHLDQLRDRAAKKREAATKKAAGRVPADAFGGSGLGGGESGAKPGAGVLGTFSGAIAGLLGRSTPELAHIAKHTERSADLLEDIADEEGMVWG